MSKDTTQKRFNELDSESFEEFCRRGLNKRTKESWRFGVRCAGQGMSFQSLYSGSDYRRSELAGYKYGQQLLEQGFVYVCPHCERAVEMNENDTSGSGNQNDS